MQVIHLSKNRLILIALLIVIACLGGLWYLRQLPVSSDNYWIREAFPPLVFLPGCEKGPPVHATASVLIETRSGAVLFAHNAEIRRAPASTTKIMTAIVALEKGKLNKIIKVSRRAAATRGSTIWLKPGDKLSLKELLEGMMLRSGNDGSVAVAEGVAGSVKEFVNLMNLKAKEIGALNTNFRNPHGLRAPSHYTTALDLALMARYGMSNPFFARLVSKKNAMLRWEERQREVEIRNTNRLLWYLEGADGVKTGTTNEAGHCLVASATRDGKQLIAVVLNSRDRWGDCLRLLEYGFGEFTRVKIADSNQPVARVKVSGAKGRYISIYPRTDLYALVRNNEISSIKPTVEIYQKQYAAPLKPGRTFGKIGYSYHGKPVEGVDLINRNPVEKKWWFW